MSATALILANGQSPRLMSAIPACLHPILGDASLLWVLRALPGSVKQAIVVDGGETKIRQAVEGWNKAGLLPCSVICSETLQADAPAFVLFGDMPLISRPTLEKVAALSASTDPVEGLKRIQACIESPSEALRIETRMDIAQIQKTAQERINLGWMDAGVTFVDPAATRVGPRVKLSSDVFLEPQVCLEGSTEAASGVRIAQGSILKDCQIGENTEIKAYTLGQEARIGCGALIGPFARLREQSVLEDRVHVGNFVETKKTTLKTGAKANHLTYLGDAEVGEGTNVGAGVITCNYDGFRKYRTVIGKNVFVGSDCQLIAPVTIGDGVTIAAGTTLTQDVPADGLAINRAPLTIKEGGGARLREKLRARLG